MSSPEEFFARVPRSTGAVRTTPASGPAYWRTAWTPRHTVAAVLLAAVLFALNGTVAGWSTGPAILGVLALVSVAGALVLASYLPSPGAPATASTCAAGPAVMTIAATFLIGQQPVTLASVALAGLLLVPAAGLRAFGPTACAS